MSKLRNFKYAEDPHEMMESPLQEAQEHMPGGYEQGEEGGEGEGDIEQLLSQLSPEELEQLAQEVSQEMQGQEGGGEDVGELAQAIQENLAQNPQASPEGLPAEKAAALNFIKSASYIEGFLTEAVDNGINLKQAVDLYDTTLTQTINNMYYNPLNKYANNSSFGDLDIQNAIAADQAARAAQQGAGEADPGMLRKLLARAQGAGRGAMDYASNKFNALSPKQKLLLALGGGALGGAGLGYGANELMSDKEAAYHSPGRFRRGTKVPPSIAKKVQKAVTSKIEDAKAYAGKKYDEGKAYVGKKYDEGKDYWDKASTGKKVGIGAGAAVLAGGAGYAGYRASRDEDGKKKKEAEYIKIASYCDGLMEQAIYNGFTPKQAEYLAHTAFNDIEKHAQITSETLDVLNHFLLENIG